MRRVIALAIKDLRLLVRDKAGFFFVFVFPLVCCMFFGAIFSSRGNGTTAMEIAIVDEDQSEGSRSFTKTLHDAPELEVEVTTREHATAGVRRGTRVAYVVLPEGFGESLENPFWGDAPPKLEVGIDPARSAESGMLEGILTQYTYQRIQQAMTDRTKMKKLINDALSELRNGDEELNPTTRAALNVFLPALSTFMDTLPEGEDAYGGFPQVQIEQDEVHRVWHGPRSSYQVSFPQGIIWGLLACTAGFGISLVTERMKGTLVRLRTAPIGRGQILAGKAVACFVTTLALQAVLLALGAAVFNVVPRSIPLLLMAMLCASLGFVGIMMLLSVLGRTEQSASGIGWAILMAMAMTGGGMIPLFFMPQWLQTISHASPVKWAILAMEGAIWRGFSFTEMLLPCGILLAVGLVCFLIGVRAFSWVQEG